LRWRDASCRTGEARERGLRCDSQSAVHRPNPIFLLYLSDTRFSRVPLRDGSYDPTIGPTFELIEVRSDHYGMGYAQFLFDHAMLFIHENAQILCHGVDSPLNTVMVKATQLLGCVVDAKAVIKDGGEYFETFTDKDLFYRFNRFDVRRAKGVMSMMEMNRIAIHKEAADEEAQR